MTWSSTSRHCRTLRFGVRAAMTAAALLVALPAVASDPDPEPPDTPAPFVYTTWQTFYAEEEGLPNDHIFALEADGDTLWVGTEGGLARYRGGRWKSWTEEDGLPFDVVSSIAVSPKTGDVWIGLFGAGLARFSAGRFDHFHQLNSGLVNDVVYGVAVLEDTVWVATTAGMSALDTVTGEWEIFTEKNAPMEEIWCYGVDARDGKVYAAVWGGGILEWDVATRVTSVLDRTGFAEVIPVVDGRDVELRGEVATTSEALRAERIVRMVRGVRHVQVSLLVADEEARGGGET